ncbi:MAG: hypothetical protein AAF389_14785 [Gemmatimonadota bacterium]
MTFLERLAEIWKKQFPPDGKPDRVVVWEDDMKLCARTIAMELRSAGHEFASDFVLALVTEEEGRDV